MPRLLATLIVLTAALIAHPQEPVPAPEGATSTVTRLQDGLIALMQSGDSLEARRETIAALLRDTHDLEYIAHIVLGRHWRDLSPEEQATFIERFEALSVATFAARFRRYGGERFGEPEESVGEAGQRQVRSMLTDAKGAPHEFTYLLREDAGQWRIVNIIVDGVSDLALKRGEYSRRMQEGGFSALLAELDRQIERLHAEAAEAT